MLFGTGVYMEGKIVPAKATATGKIVMWYHWPGETLGDKRIGLYPGDNLCVIDVKKKGDVFPSDEYVTAPIKGFLVKIIKERGESVEEGDTIGEMERYVEEPSPQPFPWDTWDTIPT